MRLFLPLLSALLLSLLGGRRRPRPPPLPAPGAPQFPAGVELVSVDVVVLDGDGQPVSGLAAADFTVEEDGAPQSIATSRPSASRSPPRPPPPSGSSPPTSKTAPGPTARSLSSTTTCT